MGATLSLVTPLEDWTIQRQFNVLDSLDVTVPKGFPGPMLFRVLNKQLVGGSLGRYRLTVLSEEGRMLRTVDRTDRPMVPPALITSVGWPFLQFLSSVEPMAFVANHYLVAAVWPSEPVDTDLLVQQMMSGRPGDFPQESVLDIYSTDWELVHSFSSSHPWTNRTERIAAWDEHDGVYVIEADQLTVRRYRFVVGPSIDFTSQVPGKAY